MKVLFAIDHYPPAPILGSHRKVLELSNRLAARGHSVTVITRRPRGDVPAEESLAAGVRVVRHPPRPARDIFWPLWPTLNPRWAVEPIRRLAPGHDCFISFYPFCSWAKRVHPSLKCLMLTGGTVKGATDYEVPQNPGSRKQRAWQKFYRWQMRRLERYCLHNADVVVAETDIVVRQLTTLYGLSSDRIAQIPAGVDLTRFSSVPRSGGPITILCVARLDRIKNIPYLLTAFSLCARDRDLRLVLAGDGSERENLERLTEQLGIRDRTTFLGHVDQVEHCYRRADIFILPSSYESQGNAALEAMAAGLPVLMLRTTPGTPWIASEEIIRDGENGFCCDPERPGHMAEQIERLAGDVALRHQMGRAARKYVEAHAAWDDIVTRFERLMAHPRTIPAS